MANLSTVIRVTHSKNQLAGWRLSYAAKEAREQSIRLSDLFERIACGLEPCTFEVVVGGTALVRASATATCASVIATDTIVINGVTFTAVANAASPTSAQFRIGAGGAGQNAECAANIAATINASTTAKVAGYVTATAAGAVVTISAVAPGVAGNMFTLTSAGGTITVTGSGFLTGGAGNNAAATSYDRS